MQRNFESMRRQTEQWARSRFRQPPRNNGIMNADIGKTVAAMTQYNILQSTGMAALQQANQAQQSVLKLLQ